MSCPPGMILNPRTLRCIKASSRIARNLVQEGVIADYFVPQAPRKTYTRRRGPAPCRPDQERNPLTGRCRKITRSKFRQTQNYRKTFMPRRQLSEGPARLPVGVATVAPMGADLGWIRNNCRNQQDPLTGVPFSYTNPYELQDTIRLHDRTCVAAQPLHYKVAAEHKMGRAATLPGHSGRYMTQSDLEALRSAMRRRIPAYKLPGRMQQTQHQQGWYMGPEY